MARITYPGGNVKANPLIVVDPDEVVAWMRSLADQLGLGDRATCTLQVDFPDSPDMGQIYAVPRLTLMVSNAPTPIRGTAGRQPGGRDGPG